MTSLADLSLGVQIKIWFAQGASLVVPNLDSLNVSSEVIHEQAFSMWRYPVLYSICYTGSILMISMIIFRRRNFK